LSRQLKNWLKAYQEYTEETESAPVFHKWVGVSMIAAALQKKVWFNFGRLKIYPNLYVVLIAEPGIARKTQAISYGTKILNEIPEITLSADATTKEALLQDLEEIGNRSETILPDMTSFKHASLSIISREFESFLGQKSENTKMLVLLTDLFDCEEIPWKYRTKNSGSNTIPSVFLNILGATTPESLASSLPSSAIGGGLTSRIIFVWAAGKTKKIPIPEINERAKSLILPLKQDLAAIARIIGGYDYSVNSRKFWVDWYNTYDERDSNRICKDPAFNGWYARKPLFLLKLSVILSAAESSEKIVETEKIEEALSFITEVELAMGRTFSAVGRSEITSDVDLVMSTIKQYRSIAEAQLMQMVWRDIDARKFDNVIRTILSTGQVKREYKREGIDTKIIYTWAGDE